MYTENGFTRISPKQQSSYKNYRKIHPSEMTRQSLPHHLLNPDPLYQEAILLRLPFQSHYPSLLLLLLYEIFLCVISLSVRSHFHHHIHPAPSLFKENTRAWATTRCLLLLVGLLVLWLNPISGTGPCVGIDNSIPIDCNGTNYCSNILSDDGHSCRHGVHMHA